MTAMDGKPAYYNECDPYCADWLRGLIGAGWIPPGDVDERDIREVRPDDLVGYGQVHLFAGLGGGGYAARLAGWPDGRPLWTGGFPCQPFSVAGVQAGTADDRYLWPDMFRLVAARRPPWVLGENVAGIIRLALDRVCLDLETVGYAVRPLGIPACAVDSPQERERVWIIARHMAHAEGIGRAARRAGRPSRDGGGPVAGAGPCLVVDADRVGRGGADGVLCAGRNTPVGAGACPVGDPDRLRTAQPPERHGQGGGRSLDASQGRGSVGDAAGARREVDALGCRGPGAGQGAAVVGTGGRRSAWADAGWIVDGDGRARRLKPGVRLLVDGFPGRVDQVRAFGNAWVPEVPAEILRAINAAHPEW